MFHKMFVFLFLNIVFNWCILSCGTNRKFDFELKNPAGLPNSTISINISHWDVGYQQHLLHHWELLSYKYIYSLNPAIIGCTGQATLPSSCCTSSLSGGDCVSPGQTSCFMWEHQTGAGKLGSEKPFMRPSMKRCVCYVVSYLEVWDEWRTHAHMQACTRIWSMHRLIVDFRLDRPWG